MIFNLLRFEGQKQQVDKFLPHLVRLCNHFYNDTTSFTTDWFKIKVSVLTNLEKKIKRHAVYKLAFKPGGISAP